MSFETSYFYIAVNHDQIAQRINRVKRYLLTKPGKIKNTQTWARNAQEKALQLSWLFLRAFFPFNLFMLYLFLVTADTKRKTNEINDKW